MHASLPDPSANRADADRRAEQFAGGGDTTGEHLIARCNGRRNAVAARASHTRRLRASHGLSAPQTATDAQLTLGASNVAFASAPPLWLARFLVRRTALPTNAAALLYLGIYSDTTISLPAAPAFTILVPATSVFADANYYLALYDPTRSSAGWLYGFEGPAVVTGTTVTFASNPCPFTFAEKQPSYYFALFVLPQNSVQPTPQPSEPACQPMQSPPPVTPSPTPNGGGNIVINIPTPSPVLCTPSSIDLEVGKTFQMSCTENEYSGPFALTVADPTIASAHQVTEQQYTSFVVTGLAVGTTTLSLQAKNGGTGSVMIVVSP